jgi:hypothetical protein
MILGQPGRAFAHSADFQWSYPEAAGDPSASNAGLTGLFHDTMRREHASVMPDRLYLEAVTGSAAIHQFVPKLAGQ